MFNRTEHIYLYAKHWYKRTDDPIEDVQTIIKNCEGQEFSRKDVIKIVFHIALKHLNDDNNNGHPDFKVEQFLSDVDPDGSWKVGYYHNKYHGGEYKDRVYDYWEAVFFTCLSTLSLTDIDDIKRLSDIDLDNGHPLSEVFKLSETAIDQREKHLEYASKLSTNL